YSSSSIIPILSYASSFSITAPPPPDISTLSLHDALPICPRQVQRPDLLPAQSPGHVDAHHPGRMCEARQNSRRKSQPEHRPANRDRKSTRLNSSHRTISYAVFCLKKKKKKK